MNQGVLLSWDCFITQVIGNFAKDTQGESNEKEKIGRVRECLSNQNYC